MNEKQKATKLCRFAKIHLRHKKIDQGIEVLKAAMSMQSGEACHLLGVLYLSGEHVTQDEEAGFAYVLQGAERRYGEAMGMVAHCYKYGLGTEVDSRSAAEWALAGSRTGDLMSTRLMGDMCYAGFGFEQDEELALEYYRTAAEAGDRQARQKAKILASGGTL